MILPWPSASSWTIGDDDGPVRVAWGPLKLWPAIVALRERETALLQRDLEFVAAGPIQLMESRSRAARLSAVECTQTAVAS